jgi:hypothetical protein
LTCDDGRRYRWLWLNRGIVNRDYGRIERALREVLGGRLTARR